MANILNILSLFLFSLAVKVREKYNSNYNGYSEMANKRLNCNKMENTYFDLGILILLYILMM